MRHKSRIIAVLMVLALILGACSKADDTAGETTTTAPAVDGDTLKVALLVEGVRNDNSFGQSGVEGITDAAAADGNIQFDIVEQVADPSDSLPVIRDFATRGYDLIIGHGIAFVDPILEVAADFPDINFLMEGGILVDGADPTDNVEDWMYNVQDMAYPNGILAANAVIGDTIGIVGGPEFDFIKLMHASFREAALSVRDDLQFLEGFAGSFTDPAKAAEVTQSLIDQGATYIYCSGDGICIGAAQVAAATGVPISVGFGSQEQTAPSAFLTATVLRLSELFQGYFQKVRSGTFGNNFTPGGLFNSQIEVLPVNQGATVETAIPLADLEVVRRDFVDSVQTGKFEIPFPG